MTERETKFNSNRIYWTNLGGYGAQCWVIEKIDDEFVRVQFVDDGSTRVVRIDSVQA